MTASRPGDQEPNSACCLFLRKTTTTTNYPCLFTVNDTERERECVCVCVCVCVCMLICVQPFVTPWTVAHQALWNFPGKNIGVGCHFLL